MHDLIDLQLCSAGVEAAIKAHDYETGKILYLYIFDDINPTKNMYYKNVYYKTSLPTSGYGGLQNALNKW